jgi:hypothetical protein
MNWVYTKLHRKLKKISTKSLFYFVEAGPGRGLEDIKKEFNVNCFDFWHGYVLHQGTAFQGRALCKSQMMSRVLRHTAAAMRAHNVLQGILEQLRWTVAAFLVYILRCCTQLLVRQMLQFSVPCDMYTSCV